MAKEKKGVRLEHISKIYQDPKTGMDFYAVDDVALEIADVEENADLVNDELDFIEDELDAIQETLDDDYDEYDDDDEDDYDEDDEDDDDDYDFGEDEAIYEVTCPSCGEEIEVSEAVLVEGSMKCPKCGEDLEFDFDEDDESI